MTPPFGVKNKTLFQSLPLEKKEKEKPIPNPHFRKISPHLFESPSFFPTWSFAPIQRACAVHVALHGPRVPSPHRTSLHSPNRSDVLRCVQRASCLVEMEEWTGGAWEKKRYYSHRLTSPKKKVMIYSSSKYMIWRYDIYIYIHTIFCFFIGNFGSVIFLNVKRP